MLSVAFIILLALIALGNFLIGYGVISWEKEGAKATKESDVRMRKIARVGGYSATVMCTIYVFEYLALL
jgi:hypothetical protein